MEIDEDLARRLVAAQFPQWAGRPIRAIEHQGWDNRTFRLGDEFAIRVPSAAAYAPQVDKEHRWLPFLAEQLTTPIPSPVAKGMPGEGLEWAWSIGTWLPGEAAAFAGIRDLPRFARDVADFLRELHRIPASEGPAPGPHNCHRGAPLSTYDAETRSAIDRLEGAFDRRGMTAIWEEALGSNWTGAPRWIHGDLSPGNLLVEGDRLCGVIDFGSLGTGDHACDLALAWTFLGAEGRSAFRDALPLDDGTWRRARGWALWKALVTVTGISAASPSARTAARSVLDDLVLAEV